VPLRAGVRAVSVGAAVAVTVLAACQPGGTAGGHHRAVAHGAVVVASFNFSESELLASIYGLAIEHAGIPVRFELGLGPRELVQPALQQGLVDLVPEYVGTALTSLEPHAATVPDPAAARSALARALARWHVRVLTLAAAEDQNGVVVTRATARRLHLSTVSDLRRVAGPLVLGAPPECPDRPFCLPGLRAVYGLRLAKFLPLDTEQQRVTALQEGVVNVAVLFTTDGYLATGNLVLLSDNRHLQPPDNVVPVITDRVVARYGKRLVSVLNAVSARLTSKDLRFLNWRIEFAGKNVLAEARGWLERQGVVARPG
jgi:osmoprotectant transport system substrate-binding protein